MTSARAGRAVRWVANVYYLDINGKRCGMVSGNDAIKFSAFAWESRDTRFLGYFQTEEAAKKAVEHAAKRGVGKG